ncbi:MAG: gliding motility-associated C-terminal domain-containing protein, partial [Chitinophagales bacterium]
GERFITIGNFNDDAHTLIDTLIYHELGWYWTYYYIDDVSLQRANPAQDDASGHLTPAAISAPLPLIIPTLLSAAAPSWEIGNLRQQTEVTVYNVIGQVMYQSANYQNNLAAGALAAGIYCYVIKEPGGNVIKGKMVVVR